MNITDWQKKVDDWTGQYTPQYWQPHEMLARLTEEVGELAREINHLYGPKKKKSSEQTKELGDEIGDVIFTLTCLANSKNIDLKKVLKRTIDKCYTRDKNRFTKK